MSKEEKIKEILTRSVDEIIERPNLEKKLKSGKKLRVKFGIDPTGSELHLGHSAVLRKLKQFQDLGHEIIFLIGDFTARIGDPSGHKEERKPLTQEEIGQNMKDYIRQAGKILNIKKTKIRYNSEWYEKKDTSFLFELTSRFTVARVLERDDFQERIKEKKEISVLEILYPLFQGYDSVALESDVELGASDQKFNLLMARRVQRRYGQEEQDILTVPLLEGLDGKSKMSKSYKNYVAIEEKPNEMYAKIMSLPDDLMWKYFELLTDLPMEKIKDWQGQVKENKVNPRDIKAKLAFEITKLLHNQEKAKKAEEEFNKVFRNKELPSQILEIAIGVKKIKAIDLMIKTKLAPSKSEARRLIEQGAVKLDKDIIKNPFQDIVIKSGMILQAGKRKYVKIE
jgi:tyrosyl-tRNA synthetase